MKQQIIAMGGGGFSMEPENLALDQYILDQTEKPRPRVCFLPTASGDSDAYLVKFYSAFSKLECQPVHLSLFRPHTADLQGFLLAQDVLYVGGGNTKSMLALWQGWGVFETLREALQRGIVLAGISAGAICWFEQGITDSIPGCLSALPGLSFLPGSCCPHYDGEAERRPAYTAMIQSEEVLPGFALDNSAALHFVDGSLNRAVRSRPQAQAWWVEKVDGQVQELPLEILTLAPWTIK